MDKAFAMGCGFIAATILIVFVICALLDRRQFKTRPAFGVPTHPDR